MQEKLEKVFADRPPYKMFSFACKYNRVSKQVWILLLQIYWQDQNLGKVMLLATMYTEYK